MLRAMTHQRVPFWFLIANGAIVFVAFVLGILLGRRTPLPDPQGTALHLVFQEIEKSYVDRIDGKELLDKAIASMARLDDYSRYVPQNEVARFVEETTGTYDGIGVVLQLAEDGVFVRFPIEGGPGDRAGLLPGDRIVAVDGQSIDTLGAEQRSRVSEERLRGPSGSVVRITVARDGASETTLEVERAAVQRRSVKWSHWIDREQAIAYAHIADFHVGAAQALRQDLDALVATEGRPMRGLVIDLRFDLGGNLDEAVSIARMFVREGNLVSMRRRDAEVVERFDADPTQCTYGDLALVLLVNESSASASEVVAGALQDHRRASVVGEPTYGKGVVNTIYQWKDQPFRLKLTTARYYTPNGRNLDRGLRRDSAPQTAENGNSPNSAGGVGPDRLAALDGAAEETVRAALAEFPAPEHHLQRLTAWSKVRQMRVPGPLSLSEDPQLAAALEEIRARLGK